MSAHVSGLDPELTEAIIETLREPIIILDKNLRVVVASRAFYDIFSVEYDGVHNKMFYELGNGEWNIPSLRARLEKVIPQKQAIEEYRVEHNFKRLGLRTMVINAREIRFDNKRQNMLVSISDITKEVATQRDKEKLMVQKDTLLKEMRHRIANSLQLIASIILLKAGSVKSEESRAHLEDAHDRILSIATVQRNLDPTSANSEVPVVVYLQTLCKSIAKTMISNRKSISVKVTGNAGTVTPDEAIGLGLITTELVINALKHAFPKGKGKITVTYDSAGAQWELVVGDDGIGLSAADMAALEGLGTSIVESLALQLNAKVKRKSSPHGTVVSVIHPSHSASVR